MIRIFPNSAAYNWGATAAEKEARYPGDDLLTMPDDVIFRAVTVHAKPETVFRWLCQLRTAPYSYDRIDNFGRRSPQTLTPGLENLEKGQSVMRIFELVSFARKDHITLRVVDRAARRVFGEIVCTYAVRPEGQGTRLIVKLLVVRPRGLFSLAGPLLPWGDLIMMRKQLLNLRDLAEKTGKEKN